MNTNLNFFSLLQRLVEFLGSIDGHRARTWMKRLNEFSAAASVYLLASGHGTWEPYVTGVIYFLSSVLEFIASKRAHNQRKQGTEPEELDPEPETELEPEEAPGGKPEGRMNLSQLLEQLALKPIPAPAPEPAPPAPIPVVVERGFPPAHEIDRTNAKLAGDPMTTVVWTDQHDGPRRKDFLGETHRYDAVMFKRSLPASSNPLIQ